MFEPEFKDKVVVITGAAGVIGRWIVQGFARAGSRLVLSDHRPDVLAADARALGLPADRVLTHATQLQDAADIGRLVEATTARFGAPDIVVNNAGVYPSGFLLDIDTEEWDRIMDVNFRAPFIVSRDYARTMVKAGKSGSIVNISSGASRKMRTTVVPYCVSKTALDRLTKGFALELAPYRIRVNALEPGFAPGSEVSPLTEAHVKATSAAVPIGRPATAEDICNGVFYLCSSAASFVTGTTLSVDGGNSIGTTNVYQDKKTAL
ncbi:MAG: SDR family oxidoreductase [Alphaproteobacteria bacterium]|nr:SDR family oxidoreductase [Alphaproteobacteria bacterium]